MDKFLKIAVTLWTLIFLVFATPEQSLTYRHPHQVLHDFKRLEYATSQLTDEHLNQVELIARILSPKNVLNKLLDKNLEISSLCFNQSLYGVESLLSGGTEGSWSLKSEFDNNAVVYQNMFSLYYSVVYYNIFKWLSRPKYFCSISVIDAWGKPGSGISTGNLAWLGDFDECQNIVSYYNSSYTSGSSFSLMPESFEGQYCSIGTSLNSAGLSLGIPGNWHSFYFTFYCFQILDLLLKNRKLD